MIDRIVRAAADMGRNRKVSLPAGVVKVNVGAGIEVADGWINVDGTLHALAAGWPAPVLSRLYRRAGSVRRQLPEAEYIARLRNHTFVFHNLEHGLPFDSGTVDYVFCSHVLEHFTREDAGTLTREMYRVLKPGGCARLCVPDLAKAIALYQSGAKHESMMYFFTEGRAGSYDQHRYMYDFDLMRGMLIDAGFSRVVQCKFREGSVPDLEKLDNRPDETLFVEAFKAGIT